ncbi:MAG: helix-turn-helix domain-containing protein [Anaerolineales bacterium]|nr:helix-turn-helix domain-containing protein [Anaerolineales bacterium]
MKTFGQLLDEHIQRAGISDAELARSVGVSRQTIFRWRQGSTRRPRFREDLLSIAEKLRLDQDERQELLLAAGFRPEKHPSALKGEPYQTTEIKETGQDQELQPKPSISIAFNTRGRIIVILAGMIVLTALGIWIAQKYSIPFLSRIDPNLEQTAILKTPITTTTYLAATTVPVKPGESLLVIAESPDHCSDSILTTRYYDAIQREIDGNRLIQARIIISNPTFDSFESALKMGKEINADLVIWSDCNAGQPTVLFAHPGTGLHSSTPTLQRTSYPLEKNNIDVTRATALLTLASVMVDNGEWETSISLLIQAGNSLYDGGNTDCITWSTANGMVCYLYSITNKPHQALSYCQLAFQTDINPAFRLGKGIAHAASKEYESAIQELTIFADWLEKNRGIQSSDLERTNYWISDLENQNNPFTTDTLSALGAELIK